MEQRNKAVKKESEEMTHAEMKSISGGVDFNNNEVAWNGDELDAILKKIKESPNPNKAALDYLQSIETQLGS
jgi:hypothetical protein